MVTEINYETICKSFYSQAKDALKNYLELEVDKGQGFIISAQALNPFLRTLETLGEKGTIIIPLSSNIKITYGLKDVNTNDLYMVIKASLVNYKISNIKMDAIW